MLSCSADLYSCSYHTQPHSLIAECLSEAGKGQKLAKSLAAYPQMACVLTAKLFFITEVTNINPIQTGGGGFSNPPTGKIVITPTPKEL